MTTISVPRLWVPRPRVYKIPIREWYDLYRPPLEWFTGKLRRNPSTGKIVRAIESGNTGALIRSDDAYNGCDCGCFDPVRDCTGTPCDWCGGSPGVRRWQYPTDYELVLNGTVIPSTGGCQDMGGGVADMNITGGTADGTYCAVATCAGVTPSGLSSVTMAGGSVGTVYTSNNGTCTGSTQSLTRLGIGVLVDTNRYTIEVDLRSASALTFRGTVFQKEEILGAPSVAQVDRVTVGGTVEVGDKFLATYTHAETGTVVNVTYTATSTALDTTASGFASAFNSAIGLSAIPVDQRPQAIFNGTGTAACNITAKHPGLAFTLTVSTTESGGGASDGQTIARSAITANAANTMDCYNFAALTNYITAVSYSGGNVTPTTSSSALVGHSGTATLLACCTPL